MLVCCSEEADPSCSRTLSNEEYASLLDAAMRFPDKQVGLCVAAMVSCGMMAGYRSDDLQDTRYFMELICSVPAEPLPMQILALANNAGKANQDAQMTYAALANHRQPHLDCLAYLSQLILYQINVSKLPLLALIYQNNMSWRSYRMFFRNPSMATRKQSYYDVSTVLLKVVATMPDTLIKTKELYRVLKPGSSVAVLDFNNSEDPFVVQFQELSLQNIVVPAARLYGLAEEYEYLRPSIKRFATG
ncbi:hypothetical protein ABBQ38_006570 [Trebouxia sp. C0009 RCD-2024]